MEERLEKLLRETVDEGLYQIILSNPRDKNGAFKIKIRPVMVKGGLLFQQTTYEGKQVFHENLDQAAVIRHIAVVLERDFKQCEVSHRGCRAVVLVSKKGKMTISKKKIVHARYDKFKQINRFLEFIEDILPTLSKENTVHIIDFGCGKSYLTFAMYYYLHELRGYDVEITGLDLKEDVITNCNALSRKYGYDKLHFIKGDIAEYEEESTVDMVVTLHACDTATDYALAKAVEWGAMVILSVPCCQHEINRQIHNEALSPLLKYGIIKERLSALVTDALRANLLEAAGYETSILEFIEMEHTPKNLLIRAVRKFGGDGNKQQRVRQEADEVMRLLHVDPTLNRLI